jgi:hypothetical protein
MRPYRLIYFINSQTTNWNSQSIEFIQDLFLWLISVFSIYNFPIQNFQNLSCFFDSESFLNDLIDNELVNILSRSQKILFFIKMISFLFLNCWFYVYIIIVK